MDALAQNAVDRARLSDRERALMRYVRILTLEPAKLTDADTAALRNAGWTDEQIFEASFITALFAFFNRMAEAYGLDYPADGWLPEERRSAPNAAPAAAPARPDVPPGAPSRAPSARGGATP